MELRTEGLTRRFDDFTFRADVHAAEGSLHCLLGPSGCGKTTALQLIAGIVEPDAGRIYLGGREITSLPPWKRGVGLVFQDYALFPHLSVAGNIAYGLKHRGYSRSAIRSRVRELLEIVHLPGYEERDPSLLSGGEKQRVALARAVAPSPGLLLLDEPLSALDAQLRGRLRREIRSVQRRLGLTTIYVTHDQEEALTLSDRLSVMRGGGVEQSGSPRELYRRPRNSFVAGFLGGSNLIPLERRSGALQPSDLEPDAMSPARFSLERIAGESEEGTETPLRLFFRPEETRVSRQPPAPARAGEQRIAFRMPVTVVEYLGSHEVVEGAAGSTVLRALVPEEERRAGDAVQAGGQAWFSVPVTATRLITQ
jgi:ABC-type Fe3+/spermidine/putrescine transport system ATPase subunit